MGASDWPGGVDLIFRELLFLGAFYFTLKKGKLLPVYSQTPLEYGKALVDQMAMGFRGC